MDGGSIPPNQRPQIKTASVDMETDRANSPASDSTEHQRYSPKGSPKYRSEQKQVAEDYDISLPPRSPAPLPDECPQWFEPWEFMYDALAELEEYFEKPARQKSFLNGQGSGYNLLILFLKKWNDYPDSEFTPEITDLINQWIESSLKKCPIPVEDIPLEFNHLNKKFNPPAEDLHFWQTEDELAAADIQSEDNEFVPGWMRDTVILGLSPHDAFRQYWNLRNDNYDAGTLFLTPKRLQTLNDPLYCWLIKFRDPKTGKAAGLREDQIELINSRLLKSDTLVNNAIKEKKDVEVYTWKTMPVIGSMEGIDLRIKDRMERLQLEASDVSTDDESTPLQQELPDDTEDFTVRIPLELLPQKSPTISGSSLFENAEVFPQEEQMEVEAPFVESEESSAEEASDTDFIPGKKRRRNKKHTDRSKISKQVPEKPPIQSDTKRPKQLTVSWSRKLTHPEMELPNDSRSSPTNEEQSSAENSGRSSKQLSRQSSRQSTASEKSGDMPSPKEKRRSSRQISQQDSKSSGDSTPKPRTYPSQEIKRHVPKGDKISYESMVDNQDEPKRLKRLEQLKEVQYLGALQGRSPQKQEKLLKLDSIDWLQRIRFRHNPEHEDHGNYLFAAIPPDSLPLVRKLGQLNPAVPDPDKASGYRYSDPKTNDPEPSSVETSVANHEHSPDMSVIGKTTIPAQLLDQLGMALVPASPDGTTSISVAVDIMAKAVQELEKRLVLFPSMQKTLNTLEQQLQAAKENTDTSALREQQIRIEQRAAPHIERAKPLQQAIAQFAESIRGQLDLLFEDENSGNQVSMRDELLTADSELKEVVWNSKKFATLQTIEKWQKLSKPHHSFLKFTKKCLALPEQDQVSDVLIQKVPEKLNKLPKKVSAPTSCLAAVQANWKEAPTTSPVGTTKIETSELAALIIRSTTTVNKKFMPKGVWTEAEGLNKYSDLTQLMEPLIEAYAQALPSDDQTTEEYQALISLHYHASMFADALQSIAHTDLASALNKQLKKHKPALERLGAKPSQNNHSPQ